MVIKKPESWVPAVGFEDIYEVSNAGNVRRKGSASYIKPSTSKHGYLQAILCVNGKAKTVKIHRLVAFSFLSGDGVVNHIDGVKANNSISNLEIISQSENVRHAYRTGLKTPSITTLPGNKNGNFKGVVVARCIETGEVIVMEGRRSFCANGFIPSSVYRCLNGKLSRHRGHIFSRITNKSERAVDGRVSA